MNDIRVYIGLVAVSILLFLCGQWGWRRAYGGDSADTTRESRYQALCRHILPYATDMTPPEYWADYYLSVVADELATFGENDWNELRAGLAGQSEAWLLRFCEVARGVGDDQTAAVLLEYMNHPNKDIAFTCLEGLQGSPCSQANAESVLAAIETVFPRLLRLEQAVMVEFRDDLLGIERVGNKLDRIKEYMRRTERNDEVPVE